MRDKCQKFMEILAIEDLAQIDSPFFAEHLDECPACSALERAVSAEMSRFIRAALLESGLLQLPERTSAVH